MTRYKVSAVAIAMAAVAVLTGGVAGAATYYYDNNSGTAGFGTAGGSWAAPTPGPTPGWSTNVTGSTVPGSVTTATADGLNFGNGATGLAGGTITVSGTVDAGDMTYASGSGAITLSTGTISLAPVATITLNNAADTIGAILAGAATNLIKTGTGTLTLSGANSFGGPLSIENGTVYTTAINNKSVNGVLGAGTLVVLGASGQTGRLAIQVDGGVSSTKDFTVATGGTGEIQFGNLNGFQITNADRPLTLSGNIGGAGNFAKLGGAAVVLSGNNTYSGTTTVSQGPLRLSSANALPGGIGATGGASALTINGGVVELTAASGNFLRGLGTGVDQFQIPGGVSGFDSNSGARQVIVGNDPSFELVWGIAAFNPSALLLGYHSAVSGGTLTLQNKLDLNGATRTVTVNASTATLSGDIRTTSGTAGITKTGAGTLVLSGANTYDGPTTISAGTLTIGNVGTFNNTSQIALLGTGRLEVNVANASLTKLVTGGGVPLGTFLRYSQAQTAAGAANGPGTIRGTVEINLTNVNPDYTLDFGSDSTFKNLVAATFTSPITLSGNASVDSSSAVFTLTTGGVTASTAGTKTLALTGSNTGANTISSVIGNGSGTLAVTKSGTGAWTLSGANTYSGTTTASAGTLTLSGASGAIGSSAVAIAGGTLTLSNANAANNGDRLSDSLAFTMNGGTFNFNNDASANDFSESVGTLTLVGGASTVAIQQAAAGRTSTLTFAGLSRTAGAINFTGAGLGTAVDPRGKITFTSAPALSGGIIGPWATVNGTAYATLSGNDVVAYSGATVTDVTRKDSGTKVIPDSSTADVRIVEGTGTLGNLTLAAATNTINSLLQSISGGTSAATVTIGASETLRVNAVTAVPTAGALTMGTAASTGTLTPATAGGGLLLVNSSANTMTVNSVMANHTSASTVTKDGSGLLKPTANNTYSGGTLLNAGTLWVTTDANLGAAGSNITVNGSCGLSFGNNTSSSTVNIGARPIAINSGAVAGLYHNYADTTITLAGAVTGSGGLNWGRDPVVAYGGGSGSVVLNLNSTGNSFTGPITVGMGTENAQGGNSQFNFSSLGDSANPLTFNFNGGAIYFSYSASGPAANLSLTSRPINLLNSNTTFRNQNATYTLTLGAVSTSTAGAKTLNLGAGGAGGTVAGAITNGVGTLSVTKAGGGTWTLSGANTYTGQTTINDGGGTLVFRSADSSLPAASTVSIGGSAAMTLLDDGAGTVNLGNNVNLNVAGTGERDGPTIFVGNNGGATTGSTIALGTFDLVAGGSDARSTQTITVTGANSYRLQMGGLIIGKRADFGAPQINPTTAPVTIAGTVTQASGKLATDSTAGDTLQLIGSASGNLVSGNIRDAADYPTNPNAKPFNLLKSGTGDWTLSGTNTYTGTTTVNQGLLRVTGALNGSGAVSVTAGRFGGTGTIGGAVTVSGTGGIELRDDAVETLTLGNDLAINGAVGANNLYFDLGPGASGTDRIVVNGNLTMAASGAAVITLNQLAGPRISAGTNDLIVATGAMEPASKFTLATTSANGNNFSLQLDDTSKILQLVVTVGVAAPPALFWTGSGADNNWSTVANWVDAAGTAASNAPGFNTDVSFYSSGAARLTTGVLDTDFDVNSLTYTTNATASTTIGGATKTLTIEAAGGITVNTPSSGTPAHTISSKVGLASSQTWAVSNGAALTVSGAIADFGGGRSLTKGGAGTLTLSGANTYGGATIVHGGTLSIPVDKMGNSTVANALGMSSAAPANLVLDPGTTLQFVSTYTGASTDRGLTINGATPGDSATLSCMMGTGGAWSGIQFTSTASPAYGTPNQTRTLVLAGTHQAAGNSVNAVNYLSASIADNGTGALSLSKTGAGSWQLRGNNTYTGTTTVNGGVLRLQSANALPGGLGVTGGTSALTLNGGVVGLEAGDFRRNLGTGSDQFQITGGTSGFGAYGAARNVVVNNDPGTELVWGAATFNPSVLVINDGTGAYPLTLANKLDLNGAVRTVAVNGNTAQLTGAVRSGSGTGGLTKTGAGTLVLSGTNTFSGVTTPAAGKLVVNNALALQSSTVNLATGDTGILTNGVGVTAYTLGGLSGARNLNLGGATVSIGRNGETTSYSGSLASGSLVKVGAGTLACTGALGSGDVTVAEGTLSSGSSTGIVDTVTVTIANGAIMDLAGGVNETVNQLYFGMKLKWAGTWGSSASPAENKDNAHFSGSGMLTVLTGGEPPRTLLIVR